MYRHSITTLLIILFLGRCVFASPMDKYVCFTKRQWCDSNLVLCSETSVAYQLVVYTAEITKGGNFNQCTECLNQTTKSLQFNNTALLNSCYEQSNCNLTEIPIPSTNQGGFLKLQYNCRTTVQTGSSTTPTGNNTAPNTVHEDKNTTTNGSNTTSNVNNTLPSENNTTLNGNNTAPNTTPNKNNTAPNTTPNENNTVPNTTPKENTTAPNTTPNENNTAPNTTPNGNNTAPNTTPNENNTAPNTTPNENNTAPNTTPIENKKATNKSSIVPIESSTSVGSRGNGSAMEQFFTDSDDPFPAAIAVSVVVSVIIVVLVVAFLMYRRGQCKHLLGKCTNGHRKHSPDRSDELVMGSMANANLTYDLSSVVDVNNYNEDYSEIDKADKENYFEYSQVNVERKQPIQRLTYNHIGHFNKSSEDTEHIYNHVGDETSQKSSTLQPDTYSHVGAMARSASGHLAEDSYAHINGVVKDLPAAYETNQYDCAVFQFNGGQTGNSGHRGNEIKSGKENNFIVVGPSKVDMNSDDSVSHSYFVLEKHEKEA